MDQIGFNVVLVEPEIPPNTGNVGRLCLATKSTLHLVKPLGFSLEDRQLKRAGLDYWEDVDLRVWDSLPALIEAKQPGERYFFVTTKMPENLLAANEPGCITIPMADTRSLNLATAVGIVLFEAVRQQR